jgi:hypothetical protein
MFLKIVFIYDILVFIDKVGAANWFGGLAQIKHGVVQRIIV